MRTEEFKEWLANRGVADADAIIRYCTNGEKVYCGGDIDAQFRKDGLKEMIHRVGNVIENKDSYIHPGFKSHLLDSIKALELYREFVRKSSTSVPDK